MSGKHLPSAKSLMNTKEFCAAAQEHRDRLFEEKIMQERKKIDADPQLITAAVEMLELLKSYTAKARAKEAAIKDGWLVTNVTETNLGDEDSKFEQQRKEINEASEAVDNMIDELRAADISFVRLDVAFDDATAGAFLGYTSRDVSSIDAKFGAPVFSSLVNETMLIQNGLLAREQEKGVICKEGVFYQANSRTEIAKDTNGNPLLATREQVVNGLALLQEKMQEKGIIVQIVNRPYEEVKKAIEEKEHAARAEVGAPAPAIAPVAEPSEKPTPAAPEGDSGVQPS